MLRTPIKRFQLTIARRLRQVYPGTGVETEWRAITNINGLYSPRLDVAVGPFSTIRHQSKREDYDRMMERSRGFVERLLAHHTTNVDTYRTSNDPRVNQARRAPVFENVTTVNWNARCLLAIEIENRVTRKHLLGGALNAAALGRLGIVVGWTEEKVKALVKLKSYWDFFESVDKNTFRAYNLLILSPKQLRNSVDAELAARRA